MNLKFVSPNALMEFPKREYTWQKDYLVMFGTPESFGYCICTYKSFAKRARWETDEGVEMDPKDFIGVAELPTDKKVSLSVQKEVAKQQAI